MRNAPRLRFGSIPDSSSIARELETKLNPFLAQLSAFTGAVATKGNQPSAKINPDAGGMEKFFYLPGRYGGQVAYGATEASGRLVLGSTAHGTKGKIYLGAALVSAYDELNNRLGINTVSPSAKLHVKGEAPVSAFYRPSAVVAASGFAQGGIAPPASLAEVVPDGDTNFIETIANNPSTTYRMRLNGDDTTGATPFPAATSSWVFRWQARVVQDAVLFPVTYTWTIQDALGVTVTSGTLEPAPGTYSPSRTVNLTLAQAQQLVAAGTFVQFDIRAFNGLGAFSTTNQFRLTWVEMEVPSGTGVGAGGVTAIFQPNATQVANNTEWQNSSGTALIDITAAGRLTIESGGTMRFIPNAAANRIPVSNASGDLTLTTVTIFSSIFDTTGTPATGDLIYRNGSSQWALRNIGSAGQFLGVSGGLPTWASIAHNLLSATHTDTVAQAAVKGKLIVGNATPAWDGLTVGSNGQVLQADSTQTLGVKWATISTSEVENLGMYGDGSDGAITLNGGAAPTGMTKVGNVYFALRDWYFDTLSVANTYTFNTAGWRTFAKTSITVDAGGIIEYSGSAGTNGGAAGGGVAGAGGTGGTGLPDTGTTPLGGSGAGGAGRSGTTGVGAAGSFGGGTTGDGGNGGASGDGENGFFGAAGGGVRTGGTVTIGKWRNTGGVVMAYNFLILVSGGAGGSGGASGGGDGFSKGGGGGGGGSGGGVIGIWAKTITINGTLRAIGGAGGNGGASDGNAGAGAGGGGGGGGFIFLYYDSYTNSGTVSVAGGAAGAVGTLGGLGGAATPASAGATGNIVKYSRLTGAFT